MRVTPLTPTLLYHYNVIAMLVNSSYLALTVDECSVCTATLDVIKTLLAMKASDVSTSVLILVVTDVSA